MINPTVTITMGDMAENHVGMEQIGTMVSKGNGFNYNDLVEIQTNFESIGANTTIINLIDYLPEGLQLNNVDAYLLVIHGGVDKIFELETNNELNKQMMLTEQIGLDVDKQAYMYGRVVNKKARWNLCFDVNGSEPDYENSKGRIVSWMEMPITNVIYQNLEKYFGPKANDLKGEANYYYDISKCGIGYHGDGERRKVIGIRLGQSMPIHFHWYYKSKPIGTHFNIELNDGDIYVMSEKTVGTDWKTKNVPTLRHATGCAKYTDI